MAELLNRKYAILQQQADANTLQAQTGQFNAQTQRTVGDAAARLDLTRTKLMPAESAAQVGKLKADTDYTSIMAKLYPDVVKSEISERASRTRLNNSNASTIDADRAYTYERPDALDTRFLPRLPSFGDFLKQF